MRLWLRLVFLIASVAIAGLFWFPRGGEQPMFRQGDVVVAAPWARATPGAIKIGAAYLSVTNRGSVPDRLVGARTPVAERVELHTNLSQDGMMQMRPVDSMPLPPGQAVRFEPSGLHLMLVNLAAPLKEGDMFPLQLTFERAGQLEVPVAVGPVGAAESPAHGQMNHHSH